MAEYSTRKLLIAAVQRGDGEEAWKACLQIVQTQPGPTSRRYAWDILAARAAQADPSRRAILVSQGIAQLETAVPPPHEAEFLHRCGRMLYSVDLARDAVGKWQQALQLDPTRLEYARAIGLAELRIASSMRLTRLPSLLDTWRRAWAWLTVAACDERFFSDWSAERCNHYQIPFDPSYSPAARLGIFRQLDRRIAAQASQARSEGHDAAADALLGLQQEFHADAAGVDVFAATLSTLRVPAGVPIPLPFDLLWFRLGLQRDDALNILQQVIEATLFATRAAADDAAHDPSQPTAGIALRQWYSRLAPVRNAMRWGHVEAAAGSLANICGQGESCQVNPKPHFPAQFGTPRCCSPSCSQFADCNPGYALSANPAMDMEQDAHRLAIVVEVERAGRWVQRTPPEHLEARRHWALAQSLGSAIDESDDVEALITGQVVGRVSELRERSDWCQQLLDAAMSAVPNPALRARFAESLTDRGIEQCNDDQWESGVHNLRLGWSLNRASDRALLNLAMGLKNLSLEQQALGLLDAAVATARELQSIIESCSAERQSSERLKELLQWAVRQC